MDRPASAGGPIGGGSHFDWRDGDNLMVTAAYEGKVYGHILFTVGQNNYQRLGNDLLDYDGHGTFSPDGRWMVTDTYPNNKLREQKLYLMDMRTEAVLPLGRYVEPPKFRGHWRCDLHPRWSPEGDMIGWVRSARCARCVAFCGRTVGSCA